MKSILNYFNFYDNSFIIVKELINEFLEKKFNNNKKNSGKKC